MKYWKVSAGTPRTTWVVLGKFDNEKDAHSFASEVLSKGGQEVMIETEGTDADAYDQA